MICGKMYVMETKLTLRLDEEVIATAKRLAKERNKSVSRMVADFITALDSPEPVKDDLPPKTRALYGLLRGAQVDEEDYKAYLEDKYL